MLSEPITAAQHAALLGDIDHQLATLRRKAGYGATRAHQVDLRQDGREPQAEELVATILPEQ